MAEKTLLETLADRASGKTESPKVQKVIAVHALKMIALTKEELVAAIESNPDHPVAIKYAGAVDRIKGTKPVAVAAIDLLALLNDHTVQVNKSPVVNGQIEVTKVVVPITPEPAPVV